eukprot:TRINITY_DN66512_c0_g1_i1.p1 TRINITY_DN66512_c0_g1~~TRINITY_DN66512_c0_g1_i1.p1  ORF type:complete len:322 (+),score=4.48 TRINITY_DN66512_c0_g1_i1:81-968(+)
MLGLSTILVSLCAIVAALSYRTVRNPAPGLFSACMGGSCLPDKHTEYDYTVGKDQIPARLVERERRKATDVRIDGPFKDSGVMSGAARRAPHRASDLQQGGTGHRVGFVDTMAAAKDMHAHMDGQTSTGRHAARNRMHHGRVEAVVDDVHRYADQHRSGRHGSQNMSDTRLYHNRTGQRRHVHGRSRSDERPCPPYENPQDGDFTFWRKYGLRQHIRVLKRYNVFYPAPDGFLVYRIVRNDDHGKYYEYSTIDENLGTVLRFDCDEYQWENAGPADTRYAIEKLEYNPEAKNPSF